MNRARLLGALLALGGAILGPCGLWADTAVEDYLLLAIQTKLNKHDKGGT